MSGSLLIPEPPLQVLPSLAKAIGLNEAIVLQQLYWLLKDERNGTLHDGRRWVYNTIPQWRQNFFPFWCERTLRQIFQNLESMFLIETCQPEGWESRRTYYRLNEGGISKLTTGNFSHSSQAAELTASNSSQAAELTASQAAESAASPILTKNTAKSTPLPPASGGGGSAMVVTAVNGRGTVPRMPSTPEAKRIAALLRRRETTGWSPKEIRAFRNLKIELEDLDVVEQYYFSESCKKENYCRRDLLTFLNNFRGEVDRARNWLEKGRKKEERESIL